MKVACDAVQFDPVRYFQHSWAGGCAPPHCAGGWWVWGGVIGVGWGGAAGGWVGGWMAAAERITCLQRRLLVPLPCRTPCAPPLPHALPHVPHHPAYAHAGDRLMGMAHPRHRAGPARPVRGGRVRARVRLNGANSTWYVWGRAVLLCACACACACLRACVRVRARVRVCVRLACRGAAGGAPRERFRGPRAYTSVSSRPPPPQRLTPTPPNPRSAPQPLRSSHLAHAVSLARRRQGAGRISAGLCGGSRAGLGGAGGGGQWGGG
jgi:hypothetical protein